MRVEGIKNITVLGAGTMGQEISLLSAICGYEVILYDISEESLLKAEKRQKEYLQQMVSTRYISQEVAKDALERITRTTDHTQAAAHADFVSESVPESIEIKQEVYSWFATLWPPQTILTINTSTLLPSSFANATGRPEKFAALHFHPHIWLSNIVDIMPHAGTLPETVDLIEEFARSIRQVPILLQKESAGYVFNAMLIPMLQAACNLAAEGVATYKDVDRAFMGVMGTKIGPFGMIDLVGLDTVYDIICHQLRTGADPNLQQVASLIKTCIADGRFGIKSGKGFYDYPEPSYQQPNFVRGNEKLKLVQGAGGR